MVIASHKCSYNKVVFPSLSVFRKDICNLNILLHEASISTHQHPYFFYLDDRLPKVQEATD